MGKGHGGSMYILVRNDVADIRKSGGGSYTRKLEHARIFSTKEAAEADRCVENERISTVAEAVGAW